MRVVALLLLFADAAIVVGQEDVVAAALAVLE